MSWKPEFKVYGEESFYSNGQNFATEAEALGSAEDRFMLWTMAKEYRAVEVSDAEYPVNCKWSKETGDVRLEV